MSNEAIEVPPELDEQAAAAYILAHQDPDPPYVPPPPSPATVRQWAAAVARVRHPGVMLARRARKHARRSAAARAEEALCLREQGQNWKAIGRALGGVSHTRARQLADAAARRRRLARARSAALDDEISAPR